MRQIFFNIFTILDNISIRWVSTDKINATAWNESKVTSIALANINFAICTLVLKIRLLSASVESYIVYIDTDDISV
jgi:hypothetical protein